MMRDYKEYPEKDAVVVWRQGEVVLCLSQHPAGHYCGYVIFPTRSVREQDYNGILTYVPVHGGITYAEERDDGNMVYGFDCAHCDDDSDPRVTDKSWLRAECVRMADAIRTVIGYEERYLLTGTNEEKAAVLDEYHDQLREEQDIAFVANDNFGTMINLLCGEL